MTFSETTLIYVPQWHLSQINADLPAPHAIAAIKWRQIYIFWTQFRRRYLSFWQRHISHSLSVK